MTQPQPIISPFYHLAFALQSLHRWQKTPLDDLHDIWKRGAPSPHSILRNPKGYDPRQVQAGNYESRIVLPTMLTTWIVQNAARLGVPMDKPTALQLIEGMRRGLTGDVQQALTNRR